MKAGQFSNEQIVAILQEAQKGEKPILQICRQKGLSEATFYTWRKKFGGRQPRDVQRLRELQKENARLKRLLAEPGTRLRVHGERRAQGSSLKKLLSAPQKRGFVAWARPLGLSQRQTCRVVKLSRSVARYRPQPPRAQEADLVERLQRIARKKRRRGYRLAHQERRREGLKGNHKPVYRLWRLAGLSVPPRKRHKRIRSTRPVPRDVVADRPSTLWCLDFVEDRTMQGTKLRLLCVTDEFTRESLAIEVGCSFTSARVCSTLAALIAARGKPCALRMDNGPEFVALALRGLCHRHGVDTSYIEPGKPWQNGFAESFPARLRDEFLDTEVFWSVLDAQVRLSVWRRYYNEERLHSRLGYQTPSEFAANWADEAQKGLEAKEPIGPTKGG